VSTGTAARPRLALFDLDHTLLSGDSDVLWCDFLMQQGLLDRAEFAARNQAMEDAYRAGTVATRDFCGFYVATLAGRTPAEWEPWRQAFLKRCIAPRLPAASHALVRRHLADGDTVVLTTATNRFIAEPTAAHLGIAHLIGTGCEIGADGRFTGGLQGEPNMREGKLLHLNAWLADRGQSLDAFDSVAYSDSMNDLPLLSAARHAVAVDPDARLRSEAAARGWAVISLR
jgi:HAD superfamily hydrolase (TIGR01490 family)